MKRPNRLFAALAACLALALTGCAAPQSGSAASPSTAQTAPSPQSAAPAGPLTTLQGSGGRPLGGFGPEGLYFVTPWARSDGSFNLWYADYATRQILPLCASPNCTHETDSCTSYIPPSPGGALPEVVGDRLVLFYPGQPGGSDSSATARLEVMGLDGSDRRETLRFAANQTAERPMVTDGSTIYARLTTYLEKETRAELVRIDPETGACQTVCPLEADRSEYLWGCADSWLLFYRMRESGSGYELFRLDLQSMEGEIVYQWNDGQSAPALYGSTLVYESEPDGYFHLLDLSTGQDTALSGYALPETGSGTLVSVYDCDGGHLLFEELVLNRQTGLMEKSTFYTLTEADAAPKEWALTWSYLGEPAPVTRVTDLDADHYLVILSEQDVSLPETGADGAARYIAGTKPQYAAIPKADYWAGNAGAALPFSDWGA